MFRLPAKRYARYNRIMKKVILIITLLLALSGYSETPRVAMVICNTNAILHASPDIQSNKVGLLIPGEVVTILDTTSARFPIGTADLLCRDFPFIKVLEPDGKTGWISGQFVFKILDIQNDPYNLLVKSKNNFFLNNTEYEIRLGRNYGIPASYKEETTGCEEYYPVILFDKSTNNFNLVRINNPPNSKGHFWNLVSDEGTGEEIISINQANNQVIFKIKCIYQEGSCSYTILLSVKEGLFYGESIDYIRSDE